MADALTEEVALLVAGTAGAAQPAEPPENSEPTSSADNEDLPVTIIEPKSGWRFIDLGELWRYRELLYFLAWRDIKVRYKQTLLGGAWAIVQPLFTMLVFAIFFGYLGRIPSDGFTYPVFAYAALVPWQLFAWGITETSRSLVANERLLTKIYFPRLVIPIAALWVGLVDFAVALGSLLLLMAWYGIVPGPAILTLPFFVLLAALTALAVG